eukprot:GILK01009959.1.p1 GENE.GILK01009959.1~~GILK01009959.1.p1  ORF type:complete len:167 (-),score=13.55 GILK01009959.1:126-626(-)
MFQSLRENWVRLFFLPIQCGAVIHLVHEYGFQVTMCLGPSMLPTLNLAGDIVLVDKLTPRWRKYRFGEVVLAKSPRDVGHTVCKRILGMPGDRVFVPANELSTEGTYIQVPAGHVWLEGDNPDNSMDSRHYGPVPQALLQGRAVYRIWPIFAPGKIPVWNRSHGSN